MTAAVAAVCISTAVHAEDAPLCATAEQAKQIQAYYAETPALPFMAGRTLKLNDAVIASALPAGQAAGTPGANFAPVWEALKGLEATTLVIKSGHVFEIHGAVPGGQASTRSKFFNLKNDGPGLSGHLRPDIIGAIYAVVIPGKEKGQVSRAVMFVNSATGESDFLVAAGGEGPPPPASVVAQFDKVMVAVKALPPACPKR